MKLLLLLVPIDWWPYVMPPVILVAAVWIWTANRKPSDEPKPKQ